MNYNETFTSPSTPSKRCSDRDITSPSRLNISSLNLRHELFVTPAANKIATPTSPPPLCNDRKRVRRQCPFQDQQVCAQFLLPKFGKDDNNGGEVNAKTPLRPRLVQRLSHPVTFTEEKGSELFMTPVANKIAPSTSPPALCRDKKRRRQCSFQGQELSSEFLLPKFDEYDNSGESNVGESPYKFQLVQRLSHPFLLKQEEKKTLSMSHKINAEQRPSSRSLLRSEKMNGVNSNNLNIVTLPRPSGLKRQSSRTAITA